MNFVNLHKPRVDRELFIVVPVTAFRIIRNGLDFLRKDICVCACVCVSVCVGESVIVCV